MTNIQRADSNSNYCQIEQMMHGKCCRWCSSCITLQEGRWHQKHLSDQTHALVWIIGGFLIL